LDTLNDNIRAIVKAALNLPDNFVRPANQNAPTGKVSEPFATVLITTVDKSGQDSVSQENDLDGVSIDETIVGQRHIVASIQFFRAGAYSLASRLGALLQGSTASGMFQQYGLGFVKVGSALNITGVVDNVYEERGQIELEFYAISEEQLTIPTYGTFPVSLHTPNKTINFEVTEP
jgi:hypothetical protein